MALDDKQIDLFIENMKKKRQLRKSFDVSNNDIQKDTFHQVPYGFPAYELSWSVFILLGMILLIFLDGTIWRLLALASLGIGLYCYYSTYKDRQAISAMGFDDIEFAFSSELARILDNNEIYFTDSNGNVKGVPAVLMRFREDKRFIDIKLLADGVYTKKVPDLMKSLENVSSLDYPLIASNKDEDGIEYYTFQLKKARKGKLNNFLYLMDNLPKDTISIGKDVIWNYVKEPHLLLTGNTGSGKSYSLMSVLAQFAYRVRQVKPGLEGAYGDILILDPKRGPQLQAFSNLMGANYFTTPGQIAGALKKAVQVMNDRYELISKEVGTSLTKANMSASELGYSPYVVAIDEYSALIAEADSKTAKEIESYVKQIIQKGRAANIVYIQAQQRPSKEGGLSGDVKLNFGLKIALGNFDNLSYSMIFGSQGDNSLPKIVDKVGHGYYYFSSEGWDSPRELYTWEYSIKSIQDFIGSDNFYKLPKKETSKEN